MKCFKLCSFSNLLTTFNFLNKKLFSCKFFSTSLDFKYNLSFKLSFQDSYFRWKLLKYKTQMVILQQITIMVPKWKSQINQE